MRGGDAFQTFSIADAEQDAQARRDDAEGEVLTCHACTFPLDPSSCIYWPGCQTHHSLHAACLARYVPVARGFAHYQHHGDTGRLEQAACPICRRPWGHSEESHARQVELIDCLRREGVALPRNGCPCQQCRELGHGPDEEDEPLNP